MSNQVKLNTAINKFNKMYSEFKNSGESTLYIVSQFLPDFIEGIAEFWGHIESPLSTFSCSSLSRRKIKDTELSLVEMECSVVSGKEYVKKLFLLSDTGNIYTAKRETFYTGGIIWTGEKELKQTDIRYTDVELFDSVENLSHLYEDGLTCDSLENTACEIVLSVFKWGLYNEKYFG